MTGRDRASIVSLGERSARVGREGLTARLLSSPIGFTALMMVITAYYLFLLSNGTFKLFAPELLSRVFDNMLVHLLHGEFTVDRNVIEFEAFTRDGKTYSYFGVFPALLRLVTIPFTNVATVEFARVSCLTAVVIFVALQLRMLLMVYNSVPLADRSSSTLTIIAAATVLSGPQLYILGTASIYHEPILWSVAMGAAFNLLVLRAALNTQGWGRGDLILLALLGGLAINTRPTIGVALCLGTVLLVGWEAWCRYGRDSSSASATIGATMRDGSMVLPMVVLALFGLVVGLVNFERWGNPLVFADFHYHYWTLRNPNRIAAIDNYGEFNLGRIWIGALYYSTGIPYLLWHVPPFAGYLSARLGGIEAPPIVPLFTNPLTVLLAAVGVFRLWHRPLLPPNGAAILRLALLGTASAAVLICAASYYAMRYHFDFSPFMTLAAVVGYRAILISSGESSVRQRSRLGFVATSLCVLGILISHYVLLIHKVWSIGEPMEVRRTLAVFAPFAFRP